MAKNTSICLFIYLMSLLLASSSGQSWCVAKSGAPQTTLQSALDYACGTGVADCSVIQQSGSCYNPNTLQNHASYAFNSYYQKKPAQTSCDFGGAATLTNTNPSAGSCIYPSSSSSGSPPAAPTTSIPQPSAPIGFGDIPPSAFGESPPPSMNSTTAMSTRVQPFIGCVILVTSIITGKFVLNI
ncbi:hypothetical protein DCAR_0205897 [Daucus carota subsp. sativus]|uniref:X8 domain-containing protein n=1 Tax=Daucus carota subsp. sativus TaxID=79200 RepID=A0AAF0WEQ3_DAUCS|nr:hypothetical protein DCAR_0205897 [Daucus carota subsp. sativus]